jgi:hypothetical protein
VGQSSAAEVAAPDDGTKVETAEDDATADVTADDDAPDGVVVVETAEIAVAGDEVVEGVPVPQAASTRLTRLSATNLPTRLQRRDSSTPCTFPRALAWSFTSPPVFPGAPVPQTMAAKQ